MSRALITEGYLTDIANAIRAKNGSSNDYTPPQMAAAIQAIPTGGDVDVEPLSVTANGTYTAPTGKAYSPVTVNVDSGETDPFALVDYVATTGTQYIDTGYLMKSSSWVEMVADITNESGKTLIFFGVRVSNNNGQFYLGTSPSASVLQDGHGSTSSNYASGSIAKYMGNKRVYVKKQTGSRALTDDILCECVTYSASSVSDSYSLYIAALNTGGVANFMPTMKMYRFRIFEGETLVHEYVPWTDDEEVVCLKDTVTNDLLYNAGTGVFVRGSDA